MVQIRGVGEGVVATADDDGLEGVDKGEKPGVVVLVGDLLEEGRGFARVAVEQGLGHLESKAARTGVVLTAVARR